MSVYSWVVEVWNAVDWEAVATDEAATAETGVLYGSMSVCSRKQRVEDLKSLRPMPT